MAPGNVVRRADRIRLVARQLLLEQGTRTTVAQIAGRAGVAKGTIYLYWPTKEDLFIQLFAEDVAASLEVIIEAIAHDNSLVHPGKLAALFLGNHDYPLAIRLTRRDAEALRLICFHEQSRAVFMSASSIGLCAAVLPPMRQHGIISDTDSLESQSYAIDAILNGFLQTFLDPGMVIELGNDSPLGILQRTMDKLLTTGRTPTRQQTTRAAEGVIHVFRGIRDEVSALVTERRETS